ncbi:MAG: transposase, partial [Alphaproteobacteria bacterium]|nr:transposase [Alphaproteobacteria bacterium]
QAAQADATEDRQLGADKRGDELPDWVANKQARLDKIRAAKAALEAEASASTSQDPSKGNDGTPPPTVPDKAQRNFTDPESRISKTKDGFIQGYNAQAAVDSHAQVIVAQGLTNEGNDQAQLVPMVKAIRTNTGRNPDELSADAGYCSAANLRDLARRRINAYVATGRQRHGTAAAVADRKYRPGIVARMATKLKRGGHRSRYRWRKQVVEPVFGHIKQARGFRQFLLRGIDKVSAEWAILCTVHNLLKLAKACPG